VPPIPMRRPGRMRMMAVEKPKNFTGTLRRLWNFFGSEKKLLLLVLAFVLADSLILLLVPFLTGRAVDFMSPGAGEVRFSSLNAVILVLLSVYLCDLALNFLMNLSVAGVSQRIVKEIRNALFSKLQHLPVSFFDTHTHGDLMSRFTNDIDNISTTISTSTVSLMSDVVSILGSFVMMLLLNLLLTLASLITIPPVVILSKTIAKKTRALFNKQQAVLGKLNGHIEESISGLLVVKAFNHEDQVIEDFAELNRELCAVGQKAQVISGYLMPLVNVLSNIGFAVIAGAGGVMAVKGMITIGVIASFLSYSKQFSRPLNDVANMFNTLQTAMAGAERIFDVLDKPDETADVPDAVALAKPRGEVEFRNVAFSYREGVPVLKKIRFKAKAGSVVALVGPTGAGKTTVVNLLNRFYDVTDGSILLDGTDIRQYTRESLRSCFGIVLQDTYLFSGTVADNIRYGKPDATDGEVRAAAEKAGADDFIRKLEKGYDTPLAESGGSLSQGQRQLVAIARAVLNDPPILILDEATSSVDTRTEMRIQKAMVDLMRGRTCFIIAHRLSTICGADIILVVTDGRIVESGSHETLLAQKGAYCRLYESQFNNTQA